MNALPKLNQLRNLRAIIQHGNISAAAQMLHQTQSTLTRSIQELEKTLGVTLLDRGMNSTVLTKAGMMFEPRMNLILNELERAVDELRQIEKLSDGKIAFGCSHFPATSIVPDVIKKFQERHNSTRITIIEGQLSELLSSLRMGKLDFFIGVVSSDLMLNEFVEERLTSCSFSVVARKGHPLANSTSLAELQTAKWYIPAASHGYYSDLETVIFPNGVKSCGSVIFGDSSTIARKLVLNEDYLFVGPRPMFLAPHHKDLISIIPVKDKLPDGHYSLIFPRNKKLTPAALNLVNEIRFAYFDFIKSHS
ncbi:LysR family transcriptional regulator [Shewanella sp. DC2-4]|uniref:LysR substrate-binding domain-containing protein n=1 Tax=Shewanella sp. DC2-4 TaxID=2739431 RepID=UPI0015675A37|nr:LysR substrate-binding domain-containing protein [Shewanella sp. DC2-4]NRD30259.1 LysR family transcriptional regulator [Shewanella sp. DC2-4]